MIIKYLKRDYKRNIIVTIALLAFIIVSALLAASASSLGVSLVYSLNEFMEKSQTSHFIQMHSGDISESDIKDFLKSNDEIKNYQIVTLLNVDNSSLFLQGNDNSENGNVIDNAFVVQNESFDFLLDENNEIIVLSAGETAVPVYYAIKYDIKVGDSISVITDNQKFDYTVAAIERDSQMNSSFISSKRFLLCQEDWDRLANVAGTKEYIIEFLLNDPKDSSVETDYSKAGLPSNGPTISYNAILFLNSLSDTILIALIILGTMLLVSIAILCVRFVMIISIDEDYEELATLKAIGVPLQYIESLYFFKYFVISLPACLIGYFLSFRLGTTIKNNVSVYMGLAEIGLLEYAVPAFASVFVCVLVMYLSRRSVKILRDTSAADALYGNKGTSREPLVKWPSIIGNNNHTGVLFKLAIKKMLSKKKQYITLLIVFTLVLCFILLPIQIMMTIESPLFITYMGVPSCDIRIDLQNTNTLEDDLKTITSMVENDSSVSGWGEYLTYTATTLNTEGESISLNFDAGDFESFPIECSSGKMPGKSDELAISELLSKESGIQLGGTIELNIGNESTSFTVSGIYQDITNGGRSCKSLYKYLERAPIRGVVCVNFNDKSTITNRMAVYSQEIDYAKITKIDDYVTQTMSDIISQIKNIVYIMYVLSLILTLVTVVMFLKLICIQNKEEIYSLGALGLNIDDLTKIYNFQILSNIIMGGICSMIIVKVFGQKMVGQILSSMGASQITFIINPFIVYVIFPFVFIAESFIAATITMRDILKPGLVHYKE